MQSHIAGDQVGGRPLSMAERALQAVRRRPNPTGPSFVSAGSYRAPAGRHAAPHRYAVWKLTYYVRGRIEAHIDDTPHAIRPGTILVVPPRAAHAERADTGYSNMYVLVHAPDRWPWPSLLAPRAWPDAERIFTLLLAELAGQAPFADEMTHTLTGHLDLALRRHATTTTQAAQIVAAAERLMFERYSTPLSITEVARHTAVSTSALRAHFAAERGCSPSERLRDIRLRHAQSLLHASDLSIEAVAVRCGFHSASHLSRHFRAQFGTAPGQLRRG